jgi:hypothetical protein
MCDQYYAIKSQALWLADGYIPTCDECYGAMNAATADLNHEIGHVDPVMVELDRTRVGLRTLISKAKDSGEVTP